MKKVTHSLRAIMALVLCLVGVSAMADDLTSVILNGTEVPVVGTVTVEVEITEGMYYSPGDVEIPFDVDGVCTALGISDISAAAEYIVNVTTSECIENTTDGWRDPAGDAAGWGTEGGVCVKIDDPSSGVINYVGTYDTTWEAGDEYDALWGFVANGKAAIVDVHISFVEAPKYKIEDLIIVNADNIPEVITERYLAQGYSPLTTTTINIQGAAEALGLSEEELAEKIWDETCTFVAFNNDMGIKVDSVQLFSVTNGWLKQSSENNDGYAGDLLDECCASAWAMSCHYFLQNFDYDLDWDEDNDWAVVTSHEFSFDVGHETSNISEALSIGESLYNYIYLINETSEGVKAYAIKHIFTLIDTPYIGGPESMEKVGEITIEMQVYPNNNYSTTALIPDLTTIAAALNCDESEIILQALANSTSFAVGSTADPEGWYFTSAGFVGSWGNGDPIFINHNTGDISSLGVGQYPGVCEVGDEFTIPLYFTYDTKYYLMTVVIKIVERPDVDLSDCQNVLKTTISITQELDDTYAWSEGVGVAFSQLQSLIGTASPELYGEDENGGYVESDTYSMTPEPGFWMTADGHPADWGSAPWGMSIGVESSDEELIFNCIQMPGLTADGDVYTGTFYLVNLEEAKMITVNLVYTIGEVVSYTSAGSMDIVLPLPTESGEEADYPFRDELEEICEDMEVDIDYFADLVTIRGTVGYTTANSVSSGVYYDMNGYAVEPPGSFFFCFDGSNLLIGATEDLDIDNPISTQAVLQCESTQLSYTLNITFVKEDEYDDYVAVKSVLADDVQGGAIYDLSGRQVAKAVKGVYIQNGKKMLVK